MAHVTMVILTVLIQIQALFHWQFLWFRRWCFSTDWKIEDMILIIGAPNKKRKKENDQILNKQTKKQVLFQPATLGKHKYADNKHGILCSGK